MQMTPLQFTSGLMSLIFVSISVGIGLVMISKYFKYKQINLLYVGITWAGIVSPWYSSSISFILVLATGQGLTPQSYFFIAFFLSPFILVIWFIAFTTLVTFQNRNLIILLSAIYGAIFEIIFLITVFTDYSSIGTLTSPVDANYNSLLVTGFLLSLMAVLVITGLMFTHESSKSDNPEIKLKGKFLSLAFISFTVGSLFDAIFDLNIVGNSIIKSD